MCLSATTSLIIALRIQVCVNDADGSNVEITKFLYGQITIALPCVLEKVRVAGHTQPKEVACGKFSGLIKKGPRISWIAAPNVMYSVSLHHWAVSYQ